jgi:purine-nucleoside phosphorylase
MLNLKDKYRTIIETIKNSIPFEPEICIILGSGLGDFAEKVKTIKSISTSSLPGYPKSTVQGHNGFLHFSEYSNKKLLIVQGRIHFYEGYKLSECVLPVHIAGKLSCKKIILTNAAGGVNSLFKPGDLMLASSFNGINIKKEITELIGLASYYQRSGLDDFPSSEVNSAIRKASLEEKVPLREGTYWFTKGPSYETPAEVQMIRKNGGDAVGMSTVHEAFFAHAIGIKTASISCITNYAAGLSPQKLSHLEVMETAELVKSDFEKLVKRTIEFL